ncbi:MAG TPA: Asp-tRNA(Asn)/Glu-tRNA(Gln) amidotransferase GatCAB subunit B, partial [Solirubrobacterales bacterium]|nr:Asp-tRNA(Asn)/Glu-tRNA(Gln) amidotransferase GatCAB subunit B [Solirubrobacterales bacterium]
ESVVEAADGIEPRILANWVTGELAAALRAAEVDGGAADSRISPPDLAKLVQLVGEKKISHGSGKTVLAAMVTGGGDPEKIVEREGLAQMSDSGELETIVEKAMADNPDAVEKIREGNGKAIGAIVGAVMRETKGRADGGEVNRLIQEKL